MRNASGWRRVARTLISMLTFLAAGASYMPSRQLGTGYHSSGIGILARNRTQKLAHCGRWKRAHVIKLVNFGTSYESRAWCAQARHAAVSSRTTTTFFLTQFRPTATYCSATDANGYAKRPKGLGKVKQATSRNEHP